MKLRFVELPDEEAFTGFLNLPTDAEPSRLTLTLSDGAYQSTRTVEVTLSAIIPVNPHQYSIAGSVCTGSQTFKAHLNYNQPNQSWFQLDQIPVTPGGDKVFEDAESVFREQGLLLVT